MTHLNSLRDGAKPEGDCGLLHIFGGDGGSSRGGGRMSVDGRPYP